MCRARPRRFIQPLSHRISFPFHSISLFPHGCVLLLHAIAASISEGSGSVCAASNGEARRILAQRAVMLSTAAAFTISIVILLLFISAFVYTPLGTLVALTWVITMGLLMAGLAYFLLETRTAANPAALGAPAVPGGGFAAPCRQKRCW